MTELPSARNYQNPFQEVELCYNNQGAINEVVEYPHRFTHPKERVCYLSKTDSHHCDKNTKV